MTDEKTASSENSQTREAVTFEHGYDELKGIVARLAEPEVPVQGMFDLFRRGKGLEIALREYLEARVGELDEIEQGENHPKSEIVAPSGNDATRQGSSDRADIPF